METLKRLYTVQVLEDEIRRLQAQANEEVTEAGFLKDKYAYIDLVKQIGALREAIGYLKSIGEEG